MPTLVRIGVGMSPLILHTASQRSSGKNEERLNAACYQFSSWIALATYSVLSVNLLFKNYHLFIPFALGMGTRKLLSQPCVSVLVGDQLNVRLIRSLQVTFSLITFLTAEGALMWLYSLYFDIFPIIVDGLNFGLEFYPQLMSGHRHSAIEENRDKTLQDFTNGEVQLENLVIDPAHFKEGIKGLEIKGLEEKDVEGFRQKLDELKQISKDIDWAKYTQPEKNELLTHAINSCDQAKDSNFVEDVEMLCSKAEGYHENAKGFLMEGLEILCWRFKKKGAEVRGEAFDEKEPTLQIRKKSGLAWDIACDNTEEFKKLEKMLKDIVDYIASNPKKEESIHILIHLSMYGNYCGARIFDVVGKVYQSLLGESLGAEELLNHDLDKYQGQFLFSIEKKLTDTKFLEYFFVRSFSSALANMLFWVTYVKHYFEAQDSKGTPHNQEYFRYLYGGPIGLNLKRVFMDQGSDFPKRAPHWKSIREESQRFFKKHYTPKALTERYQQANQIPWNSMKQWFKEQGQEDQEAYFDAEEGCWKKGAIEYFLYKQGVLGIKKVAGDTIYTRRNLKT